MRIIGLNELANWRRLGEQIPDGHPAIQRLHSRDAHGHATGRHRIRAGDDDHVIRAECVAELLAGGFPIEGPSRSRWLGHGVPA